MCSTTTVVLVCGFAGLAILALVALVIGVTGARRGKTKNTEAEMARIAREIDKINELASAGRISREEAAELKLALESRRDSGSRAEVPPRRLTKSHNRVFSGVCGGIAEWVGWDPTVVRILYVLCTLLVAGLGGVILYVILELIMPPAPPVGEVADEMPHGRGTGLSRILIVLAILAFLFLVFLALVLPFKTHRKGQPEHPRPTSAVPGARACREPHLAPQRGSSSCREVMLGAVNSGLSARRSPVRQRTEGQMPTTRARG